MSYVENLLGTNEKILFKTRKHFFVLLGSLMKELLVLAALIAGLITIQRYAEPGFVWIKLALALIGIIVLISLGFDLLRWSSETFIVTSRRVIHASGVLSKNILDSSLNKINDVILDQSLTGRIFNYGSIKILTATEEVINSLTHISDPIDFKKAMLEAKAVLEPDIHSMTPVASPAQLIEELTRMKAKNLISEEEYTEKRKEILKRM